MKERPILFSGPMVRATREGRKTQTRRPVTPQPPAGYDRVSEYVYSPTYSARWENDGPPDTLGMWTKRCHCGGPGDRLWVRETWATYEVNDPLKPSVLPHDSRVFYLADGANTGTWLSGEWRPSSNMPRWASRLTLEVTGVRVERLQEISEADAESEGIIGITPAADDGFSARHQFAALWNGINGKRAPWESNPWVWVVTFTPVEKGGSPR